MTKVWTSDGAEGHRVDISNPGQPPVGALARELTFADLPALDIPLTALQDIPQGTVVGRASDAGTGKPVALVGGELAEIIRFSNTLTDAVGGAINNFALGEIDTWRFTASATISGVSSAPLGVGREFVIENTALPGSGVVVTILQESGLSFTSNRFHTPEGLTLNLLPQQTAKWRYTGSRWTCVATAGLPLGTASVGAAQLSGGVLSALTSSSPTANGVSNNLALAAFAIAANTTLVGHTYRSAIYYTFTHTAAATPTLTIEMLVNGVVVASLVVNVVATAGTYHGFVEAVWRYTSIGAAGNVVASLRSVNAVGFAIVDFLASTNVAAVPTDTTASSSVQLRMRMTTSVASNVLTVNQAVLERLITP